MVTETMINIIAGLQFVMQFFAFAITLTMFSIDPIRKRHWRIWVGALGFTFQMGLRRTTAGLIQFGVVDGSGTFGVVDRFVLPLSITIFLLIALASIFVEMINLFGFKAMKNPVSIVRDGVANALSKKSDK